MKNIKVETDRIHGINKLFFIRENQDVVNIRYVKGKFQNIARDFLFDHT